MTAELDQPVASSSTSFQPGPTPYHESSQYRNWRYSPSELAQIRQVLNAKCVEVVVRNQELEKQAQISLGHEFTDPPPATTYLSVDEERLLLRHYCSQASKIVREGFQLPEVVESTAVTYLKRFYLKNSVMEWHPKIIMPTCVYLAAKTTNYPVLMHDFRERFAKLNPQDILDTEFLVSQSLAFEFWVRGPEKALRGWGLELQSQPSIDVSTIQAAIPPALGYLAHSRYTDAEFIYSTSQIGLACFRETNRTLVDGFLEWKYAGGTASLDDGTDGSNNGGPDSGEDGLAGLPYGISKPDLTAILDEIQALIKLGAGPLDLKLVKGIDKRLKSCTNPEKVPGTALYIKRKQEQEASLAAGKAEKTLKLKKKMEDDQDFFGGSLLPTTKKEKKVMSPRVSLGSDRGLDGDIHKVHEGMGIKDEGEGLLVGGDGLKEVGKLHEAQ